MDQMFSYQILLSFWAYVPPSSIAGESAIPIVRSHSGTHQRPISPVHCTPRHPVVKQSSFLHSKHIIFVDTLNCAAFLHSIPVWRLFPRTILPSGCYHSGFLFFVQCYNLFFTQHLQRHFHHTYRTFHNLGSCGHNSSSLLPL